MSTAIAKVGGGFAIAPANMGELFRFAEMLAASDLVPKDYHGKPGNCMVAMQMGGELGLSPMQSIQNIAVINGRPSLWGDAMLAVCLPYLDIFEESDDGATAICIAKRGNRTVTQRFSTEDAKRAGLADKAGPWKQYPARMRQMRARGFCLRDICADVLRGINSAEEAQDIPREVRAEVTSSKPVDEPKAKPEAKQERKSEPPPAGAKVADTFPDKKWAGKPLSEAPFETLEDYRVWLESILKDDRRARLHKKAKQSLDEAAAEVDRRIEAEAAKQPPPPAQPDPVAVGMQKIVDQDQADPDPNNGAEIDAWGLAPPQ